ncbi:MAG: hypothetical protein JO359_03260, partial [Candidatus Eremiobacteraeota bacterium]|nr:hypothetical protein [Candidatus Eremiobacteraeota bacterium]
MATAGCGQTLGPREPGFAGAARPAAAQKIRHIVVVIQENRSYDNFFATFPGGTGSTYGRTSGGETVPLTKVPLAGGSDPLHNHDTFVLEYDSGKMDGFDLAKFGKPQSSPYAAYEYVDPAQIAPYWTLAKRYVLADKLFATQSSGSFTAHQDLIAGDTLVGAQTSVIDYPSMRPWGCDAPPGTVTSTISPKGISKFTGPFPCFSYDTLADLLERRHLPWRIYSPTVVPPRGGDLWNPFEAIDEVRHGAQWTKNVRSPETTIFRDVADGKLAAVTWVIPDHQNSDHPGSPIDTGPSWVAGIVDAIGESKFWNSTAIVILWDDWGGFYDNAVPPQVDYQGLGFRVPMIVVSPYAKAGVVSHTQYEFGSILRFAEDTFSLGRLGTTDVRA